MEEGSSSAPRTLNLFPLHPSSPGGSSSSPILNASMAMPPPLLNLFPLRPSGPGSSSSSSPIQNAGTVTPQKRELPAKDNVAMPPPLLILFPLHPSGPGSSSSSSSPIQNANMVTPQEVELPGKGPSQWKIKKKLMESDLGHLSRLMLPMDCVKTHVFPLMDEEMKRRVQDEDGMKVTVRDEDTGHGHELVFRRWKSSGSFVLNGGWTKLFVKKRGLKVGDEIGMRWDGFDGKFYFKVLGRASRGPGNTPT